MEKRDINITGPMFGASPQMDDFKDDLSPSEPPAETEHRTATTSYRKHIWTYVFWGIRFLFILAFPALMLSIPVILYRNNSYLDVDSVSTTDERQNRQVMFYVFL